MNSSTSRGCYDKKQSIFWSVRNVSCSFCCISESLGVFLTITTFVGSSSVASSLVGAQETWEA